MHALDFDPELVRRLAQPGPRYGAYPGAERFSPDFGYRDFLQAVASLRTRGSVKPLALHLQMKSRAKAAVYLSYLKREVEMQGRLFTGMNQVEQLHFGSGAPSGLSDAQMEELMLHLRRCFQFAPDDVGEYAIEVDPHSVTRERILSLRRQGFNRISLGDAGHGTEALVAAAREAHFRSVSIDLAYGQDMPAMAQALANVIGAGPDRIALSNPVPDARTCLAMLLLCIRNLDKAGYVYIGMELFARRGDDLAIARQQGRLHRNFLGYSAHAEMDLVACGVSAISAVANTYSQNVKTLETYYDMIDRNELPIGRGIRLTMDDALRRTIMHMLMCQSELSIPCIEQAYPIVFADYFAPELAKLAALARDGLVTLDAEWLSVTEKGRMLVRNVCMVFDRYLGTNAAWTA